MSKQSNYTPGPWDFEAEPGYGVYVGNDDGNVAEVLCDQVRITDPIAIANARLIAAAPDVLRSLEELLAYVETGAYPSGMEKRARCAIAKAKGE